MIRQNSRVLRKPPATHDYGTPLCPFRDEGDVVTMLDDGRALVRWRLSGCYNIEKVADLIEWETPS